MRHFLVFLALGLLAACNSMPYSNTSPSVPATEEAATEKTEAADPAPEYKLGAGDELRLIVFGEEGLSGEFVVDGSGFVSLPLIGEVSAQDKTVREFQIAVQEALKDGYLNDPKVSAEVKNFRPYYILGEVGKPGTYPYSDGLTVMKAVATAEGFTYRANKKTVYIRRAENEDETQIRLSPTTVVSPGDTIRIVERLW